MDERRHHRATEVDKSTPQRRSHEWWRSEGISEIRDKGGNNTWAYQCDMDVEVSQYLETGRTERDADSWVKISLKEDRLTMEMLESWSILCLEEERTFLFSNESFLDITWRIDKKNPNRDSMTLCRDICSISDSLLDVCRVFRTLSGRTLSFLDPDTSSMYIDVL